MTDLLIIGTDVHALEMVEIVERMNRVDETWILLGFITQDENHLGQVLAGYPVLGVIDDLPKYPNAKLVPDNVAAKYLNISRDRFTSIIDPSSFVSRTAKIGAGCVIYPNCYIGLNACLGDFVFCLSGVIINHDDVIEDRVVIASAVTLAGNVYVEADCYLGQSCTCRQFTRIGKKSLIGMGSVVVKDVPQESVMVGNPAYKLRNISEV